MITSPEPLSVRFDEDSFWVDLDDGRTLGVPLAWFPCLLQASPAERAAVELSRDGLHWDAMACTGTRSMRTFRSRDCWQDVVT